MRIMENECVNDQGLILGASALPKNVRARLEAFEQLAPIGTGEAFADIGSGSGQFSIALASRCRRISLIDIQPQNIEMAKAAFAGMSSAIVDFHCAPAEILPFADSSYDAVFLIEVLDHVRKVSTCLKEALRILRAEGRCYVSVPNRFFPFETHPVRFLGRSFNPRLFPFLPWFPPIHRRMATARMFTAAGLRRAAESVGFRSAATGYVMPPFEMSGLSHLQRLAHAFGRSPLRVFGVSIAAVLTKGAVTHNGRCDDFSDR